MVNVDSRVSDLLKHNVAGQSGCLTNEQKAQKEPIKVGEYVHRSITPSVAYWSFLSESEAVGNPDTFSMVTMREITSSEGGPVTLVGQACSQKADPEVNLESTSQSSKPSVILSDRHGRDLSKLMDQLKRLLKVGIQMSQAPDRENRLSP